jgi:hypothetical protein
VINISSGEGEIVYLCSRLQKDIPLATSVEQLTSLLQGCLELVRSSDAHQPQTPNAFWSPRKPVAVLPTSFD